MRLCRMLAIVFDPAPPLPAYLKKPSGAVTSTAAAAGAAAGADDDDDDNAAADDFGGLPLSASASLPWTCSAGPRTHARSTACGSWTLPTLKWQPREAN
jgi:hypothetical protein